MLYLKNCHIIDEVSDYIDDILIDSGKIKLIGKAKITIYYISSQHKRYIMS